MSIVRQPLLARKNWVRGGVAVLLIAVAGGVLLYAHAPSAHAATSVAQAAAPLGDPYGNEPRDAAYAVPGVLDYRSWKPGYDVAEVGSAPSAYRRLATARKRLEASQARTKIEVVAPPITAATADPLAQPDTPEVKDATSR